VLTAPPVPMAPRPSASAPSRSLVPAAAAAVIVLGGVAAFWLLRSDPSAGPATAAPSVSAPVAAAPAAVPSETAATDRPAGATEPAPDPVIPVKRPGNGAGASSGTVRVARKPGESLEAWRSRSDALQTRYGYSKAAMERGDFAAASGGFEAILLEEPGFRDTAQLLVQSQAGLRSNARSLHQAGTRLEASGDWVGALQKYEQARQIFSGIQGLSGDVQRMKEKLRIAGTNAFTQAKAHESAGRIEDAVREYEKAVQWLPADDPNRQIARSRVEQLKKH
jgi:tetratricopeptide (TPR) repeat protein